MQGSSTGCFLAIIILDILFRALKDKQDVGVFSAAGRVTGLGYSDDFKGFASTLGELRRLFKFVKFNLEEVANLEISMSKTKFLVYGGNKFKH